ncbi:MAG: double-strand break repair helicase AddA [Pseudorhodoplanes sp.]
MSRIIPPDVKERQRAASDPALSAWVAANAGSGKTHVLTQRVIRLLLQGVDPSKILCITFTKAAAANMATRVYDTLAAWTKLNDDELARRIEDTGARFDDGDLVRARRLFATALETPGGLKVQTIHALCTRLLHQFPFEANVAARFTVLDDTAQNQLLDRTSLDVMLEGAAKPDSPLGKALLSTIASGSDQAFRDVVGEAIQSRKDLIAWRGYAGNTDAALEQLSRTLGLSLNDTAEGLEAEFFGNSHLAASEWPAVIAILEKGTVSDQRQAKRLSEALHASGAIQRKAYLSIFTNNDEQPRARLLTAATASSYPDLFERLAAEQHRICTWLERRRAVDCRDRTAALLRVADEVLTRYAAEKDRRGVLDYDDLIEKTLSLFANSSAAWVLYKLDLGIDHILIDETQDTSPRQWDIIRQFVGEFTAGAGARTVPRTFFAVGDDKQSIFSFQGAEPGEFDTIHRQFQDAFRDAELDWESVKLQTSFRSGAVILGAVDAVFSRPAAFQGLSADNVGTVHSALEDAVPGRVEIWEAIQPEERPEILGWDAPFDTLRETSPRVRLANKIARHIAMLMARRQPIGSTGRPITPGDILILVRQRGPLFEAIIRALKSERVPVAGADRLLLSEHIAVMDLMVLADSLLLPEDDLALATVLKSPLFGLTEEELFELAWNRTGSLHAALVGKSAAHPRFARAAARWERLARAARTKKPFDFYASLLGPEGGRKCMVARLGHEAVDALDEFLNLALDYEKRETPSLPGFMAYLRAAQAEVKRDMELARDEVRVMTVHGAKGLEAPVVILADTMTRPEGSHPPRLLRLPNGTAAGVPDCIAWVAAKKYDVPLLGEARQKAQRAAEEEYRRLLYVAMTRAAEHLIVCAAEGARKPPGGCWYELISDALKPMSNERKGDDGTVWIFGTQDMQSSAATHAPSAVESAIPDWLERHAPPAPPSIRLLRPSDDPDADVQHVSPRKADTADGDNTALLRGRVVHRLMQSLPDVPMERREDALRRYLALSGRELDPEEHERIAQAVLAILDDDRFAALFAPGSRAEVPIVGRLAGSPPLAVSGQVDRLAVASDAVLIGDYKTNRPAPRDLSETPRSYIRQLALYRAILRQLYPNRAVKAALIWTDSAHLMEIPAEMMDQALASITSR